jgi:hypothetical protein
MLCLYGATAGKFPERINGGVRKYSPMLMQYAFGGLFSGMLIFYGRSGSWQVSWPFLLMIIGVIFGNETIKDRVQRLIYNVAMLFVGLFAFVVLIVPVLIGEMGPVVFIGSGILALIIMLSFIRVLAFVVPRFIALHQRSLIFVIGIIFTIFNFLYFFNIIPPIPLSLKEVGIYHSVVHFVDNNTYQLKYEKGPWWQFYKQSDDVVHPEAGGSVFCYAKVYAPTKLQIDIFHKWEYFDTEQNKWVEYFRSSYPVTHVNNDGYRGYTLIEHYKEGKWRCTIETARGQVLGSEEFKVEQGTTLVPLTTRLE